MRSILIAIAVFFIASILSCSKNNSTDHCFENTTTVRQITNVNATVKESGGSFYIVEQGSIDTKLNPCKLESQYQINNLLVIVSGDVKLTDRGSGPCCTDNFVITKISK